VPYASKEELYALVWQKCNICNLSGVKDDWETNFILVAINEMKWNYSNEEAIKYLNTRFAQ
jgi:hypothetical protein